MARMIPATPDPGTKSSAEMRVFELLRQAPGTEDWIVLHSLNLSQRGKKPYGEVDFVVLIPRGGVFALEVKGGRVSCKDGVWSTVDRTGATSLLTRSPFKQAQEGMWALREAITKAPRSPRHLADIPFGSAVIMPDVSWQQTSTEWAPWECLDSGAVTQGLVPSLRRLAELQQQRLHLEGSAADTTSLAVIRDILRPDFETVLSRSATLNASEAQLIRLTEEQFRVLDVMDMNDRGLFEGAAGTGKTMLALELARREANAGRRTVLVCFNKLLGSWLAAQVQGTPNLRAGHFHELLRDIIGRSSLNATFLTCVKQGAATFWSSTFPELAWQAIEELDERCETLIVDEGQDLLRPAMLDVFEAWTRDGLRDGRWAVFADFERQAIFDKKPGNEIRTSLLSCATQVIRFPLKENCRNTKRIARETALLSGFPKPPYRLGQVDGVPVDGTFCSTHEEMAQKLATRVNAFLKEGGRAEDLVVLSHRKLEHSAAALVAKEDGFRILDASAVAPERSRLPVIRFATIQAFKGMESAAVIVCDVDALGDSEPQALLYVGLSRARAQLGLIMHTGVRSSYEASRARQFSPEWT